MNDLALVPIDHIKNIIFGSLSGLIIGSLL